LGGGKLGGHGGGKLIFSKQATCHAVGGGEVFRDILSFQRPKDCQDRKDGGGYVRTNQKKKNKQNYSGAVGLLIMKPEGGDTRRRHPIQKKRTWVKREGTPTAVKVSKTGGGGLKSLRSLFDLKMTAKASRKTRKNQLKNQH